MPASSARPHGRAPRPVVHRFAAPDVAGLLDLLDRHADADAGAAPGDDIVVGAGPARLALVDPTDRTRTLARRLVDAGEPWHGRSDIWFSPAGLVGTGGRVAIMFPGVEPAFEIERADIAGLCAHLGLEAPALDDSTIGHRSSAIIRLGLLLDGVLRSLGVTPDLLLGHSLGEWTGTAASGMTPLRSVPELIASIDLDRIALPDVDFAAIGAGVDAVNGVLADLLASNPAVTLSHDNCARQSVLCGPGPDLDVALDRLRAANLLGARLHLRSGFHTPAMAPYLDPVHEALDRVPLGAATIPLWSATTCEPYPTDAAEIRALHLRHLVEPVRWRELIERLHAEGVRVFVQAGTGSLPGFVDDTLADRDHLAISAIVAKRSALDQLRRVLAALWVEGADLDVHALDEPVAPAPPTPARAVVSVPGTATPTISTSRRAAEDRPVAAENPVLAAARQVFADAAAASQQVLDAAASRPLDARPVGPRVVRRQVAALRTPRAPRSRVTVPGLGSVPQPSEPSVGGHPTSPSEPPIMAAAAATPPTTGRGPAAPPVVTDPPAPVAAAPVEPPASYPVKHAWTRTLSIDVMPEVLDHALMAQPEGWADPRDLFPVVPLTAQIEELAEAAVEHAPGRVVRSLEHLRVLTWLDIAVPVELGVDATFESADRVRVAFGKHSRALATLGDAFVPSAPASIAPLSNERPTVHDAQELFDRMLMFHGPAYRGIERLGPIGDEGVLGRFIALPAKGALLDNVGKLVAYWVMEQRGWGESAFPIGIDRIDFFGPALADGTPVEVDVRITDLGDDKVKADCDLYLEDGSRWCRIEGWQAHIFAGDERVSPVLRFPRSHLVGEPQPGGWLLLRERWPTGATRDMVARRYLSQAERAEYEAQNLRDQRSWLLERVAAKDAVRHWLAARGVEVFPIEVAVTTAADGRVEIASPWLDGHDLRVAVAHVEWCSAAVVAEGVDPRIELIERPGAAALDALAPGGPDRHVAAIDPDDLTSAAGHPLAVAWSVPGTVIDLTDDAPTIDLTDAAARAAELAPS